MESFRCKVCSLTLKSLYPSHEKVHFKKCQTLKYFTYSNGSCKICDLREENIYLHLVRSHLEEISRKFDEIAANFAKQETCSSFSFDDDKENLGNLEDSMDSDNDVEVLEELYKRRTKRKSVKPKKFRADDDGHEPETHDTATKSSLRQCEICLAKVSPKSYHRHREECLVYKNCLRKTQGGFQCSFCLSMFQNVMVGYQHMKWVHKDNILGKCSYCEGPCLNYCRELSKLIKNGTQCSKCPFNSALKTELYKHIVRNHYENSECFQKCSYCLENFGKQKLETHENVCMIHSRLMKKEAENSFRCQVCNATSNSRKNMLSHINYAHRNEFKKIEQELKKRPMSKKIKNMRPKVIIERLKIPKMLRRVSKATSENVSKSIKNDDKNGNEKDHACPMCPSYFGSVNYIQKHLTIHHKLPEKLIKNLTNTGGPLEIKRNNN